MIIKKYAQRQKEGIPRQGIAHRDLLKGLYAEENLRNRVRLKN